MALFLQHHAVADRSRPSKLTKSHSWASIQLSTCIKTSYAPLVLCTTIHSHTISQIRIIIIILLFFLFFFSEPAISILEQVDGLILSQRISRVGSHINLLSCIFLGDVCGFLSHQELLSLVGASPLARSCTWRQDKCASIFGGKTLPPASSIRFLQRGVNLSKFRCF